MTDQSARELEREAEQARAKVSDTADSIRNKMSPGQLMDEFTGYFSGGDGSVALKNLGGQVRDNPMPIALIGLGLAWLMLGKARTTSPSFDESSDPFGDSQDGPVGNAEPATASTLSAVGNSLAGTATDAAAAVRSFGQTAKERLSGMTDETSFSSTALADKAKQTASVVLGQDPLVLAALGLAVGTAIGAVLPHTALEDQQLGPYRDRLAKAAEGAVNKGVEAAKDVAGKAYATAKAEADHVDENDKTVVEKVGAVVESVATGAEADIREKIGI